MTASTYRYTITLVPGSVITLLLFLFMMALVSTGIQAPVDIDNVPVISVFEKPVREPPRPKPVKPVEPPEAQIPPPKAKQVFDARPVPGISEPPIAGSFDRTITGPAVDSRDPLPVFVAQPVYPARALRRGVGGYAVVNLTISATGGIKNPVIVEEHPRGYGFGEAALKAAGRLKYQPRIVDGEPVEVPGVKYRYSFRIDE